VAGARKVNVYIVRKFTRPRSARNETKTARAKELCSEDSSDFSGSVRWAIAHFAGKVAGN